MAVLARELLDSAGAVTEPGKLNQPQHAIGTGAFIYKSIEEGISTELVRNPDYWGTGLPYLDGIRRLRLWLGAPTERAWAAFQGGQVDIAPVPGTEVKTYLAKQGQGFSPAWAPDDFPHMAVPNTKVKPFDDTRVTKALRLLIDHDETITAWADVWGGRGSFGSYLTSNLASWDLEQEQFRNHLEWKQPKDQAVREALSLLSAAGFTRDNPLRFEITTAGGWWEAVQAGGILLQGQFTRLGQGVVQTQMRLLADNSTYQTARASRGYAYGFLTNAVSYHEPDAWFTQAYRSNGGRNYWNYEDSRLDAMIDRQRITFDVQQRKSQVREILTYMLENHPGVITSGVYILNALNPKLRGYSPENVMVGRQYRQVWLDS
jgi:peptide/nickel transport system substrate-binding protein